MARFRFFLRTGTLLVGAFFFVRLFIFPPVFVPVVAPVIVAPPFVAVIAAVILVPAFAAVIVISAFVAVFIPAVTAVFASVFVAVVAPVIVAPVIRPVIIIAAAIVSVIRIRFSLAVCGGAHLVLLVFLARPFKKRFFLFFAKILFRLYFLGPFLHAFHDRFFVGISR